MSNSQFHVGIIGAGLGGLAAAVGIARAGHKVTVLEQARVLDVVGAGIQVPPNASSILKQWGLLDKIRAAAVHPVDFVLRSYYDGKVLSRQNVLPWTEERYGAPYLHIHRADYHAILLEEAQRLGVEIQLGSHVTGIDFERRAVLVRGKPDFFPDVVVGADGLKSACREALLGHPDPPHLTGDLAYRITVKVEDMEKKAELRELFDPPCTNYWMGPEAHVVCYLLQGGSLCNIVLICPDNLPDSVNIAKADLQEMRESFRDWDPRLQALLELVQDTSKWKLRNSEEMQTWRDPSGYLVLLGDACHATLPYLAQGAAQAIEDGAVLGALFENIQSRDQLHDLLTIYEVIRKSRTTQIVKGSTALRDIFHMANGPRQQERDRQLLTQEPFEGFPNRWADPAFQQFMFGYDAYAEAYQAWKTYMNGKFPNTTGWFQARL